MVTYPTSGKYDVVLRVTNGTTTMVIGKLNASIVTECTGLSENEGLAVDVFQNPAKDFLHISGNSNAEYKVYNLIGSELQKGSLKEGEMTKIDLQTLPAGLYMLTITKGNQTRSIKVIKE